MGAGEVGRELGDAGGPLLVAAMASIAGLGAGLLGLAVGLWSSLTMPPDNRRLEPYQWQTPVPPPAPRRNGSSRRVDPFGVEDDGVTAGRASPSSAR